MWGRRIAAWCGCVVWLALLPLADAASAAVRRAERVVHVGPTRVVHYVETLPADARPRRTAIFLTGPIAKGSSMTTIPVAGFDAAALLTRAGYAVASPDFEGTGASTSPPDGRSVTTASQVQAMAAVIDDLRRRTGLPRPTDVIGESWGGGIAAELCADPTRARACVLSTMTYRDPPLAAALVFGNAGFQGLLDAMRDGYWRTTAPLYLGLVPTSPPAVQRYVLSTQPGRYPISQFKEYGRRPWFDPGRARVPALVVRGADDPITAAADNAELVAAYGGAASSVAIPGGHHLPRLEAGPRVAWWRAVLIFLRHARPLTQIS